MAKVDLNLSGTICVAEYHCSSEEMDEPHFETNEERLVWLEK